MGSVRKRSSETFNEIVAVKTLKGNSNCILFDYYFAKIPPKMHLESTVAQIPDNFGVISGVSCIGDHITVAQLVLLNECQIKSCKYYHNFYLIGFTPEVKHC